MEVSGQNIVKCDEEKALKCLLDAFGSVFSLEEIASAYCKASRDADLAGEILYGMQGSSSTSATHFSDADAGTGVSSVSSDGYSFEKFCQERKNTRPKGRAVSAGAVSSIIGKDYVRSLPSANGSFGVTKPVKLDANLLPMTGIWREKSKPNTLKHDLHQDMENFLFKMLGDGFQLDRNMIREVLDTCGYDMTKSLEKLLDQSITALSKRKAIGDSAGKFSDMKAKSKAPSSEKKSQDLNYPKGDGNIVSTKGMELHKQQKGKHDLQKEVLSSLFNYHGHPEKAPKRIVKDLKKNSRYGHVVFEPPKEYNEECKIDMNFSRLENIDDPEDEEDYQNARKAVKEYRAAMNEYYKAAVDAFTQGDQIKAEKLLGQGQFFLSKAHEADEESSRMILETRTTEAQEMVLDLRDHGSKEAIRLLKCHLSSLSGIPSFEYLKLIIGANDEDNTKGSRRRLRVLKLLEQESIKWVEGETADTILIRLANIERNRLSFLKT
ncbi:putative nuclear RNA export factor SDE5 isoform X2 [Abrus precatorius]|uniref:Nuclear RNA export factor SDE5 isoform X2 n=1 Tax=Abrus precatorius TaxID=3816 RepID=A0A8B8JR91_ABRPR|nr:putative nuclear RNA export factor SDE5 isoform X2 [Abrus precatorius]XP_027334006.1 putative nuclear RNA export factor SDE5 isoform X2 [Abrus precatorius]